MVTHARTAFVFGIALLLGIAPAAIAAETYSIDPVHASFIFRIKHLNLSYSYGRFNDCSGSFTIDEADPSNNTIELEVKTDSIDTANADRDAHLKNEDFFDAEKYPTMTFKSTAFKKSGDDTYDVTGDLTIHGVTKEITIKAEFTGSGTDPRAGTRAGWETTFTIDRTEFGMTKFEDTMVGHDVTIIVSIEGVKK